MCNPVETIERFNREFVPRFHHRPIELLEDELKLVLALKADSWEEFVELVAIITTNCRGKVGTTLSTGYPCREGEVAIEYPF